MLLRTLLGLVLLVAATFAGSGASARPVASDVRIGDNGGETRVVMDLTEPVRFNVFVLPDPYRVVVDLPDMQWSVPAGAGSAGRGLVQGFRFGRFQAGAAARDRGWL